MAKEKHSTKKKLLIESLTKLRKNVQKNIRDTAALIPWKNEVILSPAQSHGPEVDRFRDPEQALVTWPNKQQQRWCFTGNVANEAGRTFSFELSFKIRHTHLDHLGGTIPTRWLRPQIQAAHFAISDQLNGNRSKQFQYWQKGGPLSSLSGFASEDRFHLELDGWYAKRNPTGTMSIYAAAGGSSISLHMTPSKPLAYHAQRGFFQLGERLGDSEYYCSYTNLTTRGEILIDGKLYDVTGSSWLDHEKSTSLGGDQAVSSNCNDRFLINLPSGEELMLHLIHDGKGKPNHFSTGTFIDRSGAATHLISTDFRIETTQFWKSKKSGNRYPVKRHLHIESLGLDLNLKPLIDRCELDTFKSTIDTYWEGPISVQGARRGENFSASGFMELTGYDLSPRGKIMHRILK